MGRGFSDLLKLSQGEGVKEGTCPAGGSGTGGPGRPRSGGKSGWEGSLAQAEGYSLVAGGGEVLGFPEKVVSSD